jgi:hypothetical protein
MNGHLIAVQQPWSVGTWHTTAFVALPAGCASVRGTVTPAAEVRSDPRLACEVFLVFRDADGNQVQGCGCGFVAREEFEADEPTPISGHEASSSPGVLPTTLGPFAYVAEDSPAAQQGPYRQFVAVQFRASFLDRATIDLGVTVEAFDVDGNALEVSAWL